MISGGRRGGAGWVGGARAGVLCACLVLLGCAWATGQNPDLRGTHAESSPPRVVVPLVSDSCPIVRQGQSISLDWYPGFDIPGIVTGIRGFRLTFGALLVDGVTVRTRPAVVLGGRADRFSAVNAWNGYFHFELPISRAVTPGTYRLIDAEGTAETDQDYRGPAMKMTNSPVDSRFCITVEPLSSTEPKAASK